MKKLMKVFLMLFMLLNLFCLNVFASEWSEWQDETISSSDTIEVETRQVPSLYKMIVFVCTDYDSPSKRSYYTSRQEILRAQWDDQWTPEQFESAQKIPKGTYWDYANNVAGYIRSDDAYAIDYMPYYIDKIEYKTQYRYRNKEEKKVIETTQSSKDIAQQQVAKNEEKDDIETMQYVAPAIESNKTATKEKKKSKGKKMNGGAKVWTGTSDNQNQASENTVNNIIENDNFIVMDEVVNGDNVTTIIPDMSKLISPIDDIFNQSSYVFDKQVGKFAAKLSKEAYNGGFVTNNTGELPIEIISTLKGHNFSGIKTYNYIKDDTLDGRYINSNCFVIGHRILNDDSAILCIVARGTKHIGEIIADGFNNDCTNKFGFKVYNDINNFSEQIRIGVNKYFETNPDLKNVKNMKVLITGHSLGGAAANLYGAMFLNDVKDGKCVNKYIKTEDVFTYTYGAIKVIDCNTYDNIIDGFENIFNIYNYYDSFGPHGTKDYFGASSPCQKFGYTLIYQDERYHYREDPNNPLDFPNHDMDNYIKVAEIYDFKDYKIAEDLTKTGEIIIEEVIDGKDITTIIPDMSHNVMNENVELDNFQSYYDKPLDITSDYNGRLVKIFSKETNHYISNEEGTIHADGEGGEGVFITQTTADGWVGFKRQNGNWLSVQDGGYVRAEGRNLSSWECFKVYQYKDNMYLLSQKENKYVQVINDGIQITNPLQAARKIEDGLEGATWERFDIVFVDGK